jgi:hypothetical protein
MLIVACGASFSPLYAKAIVAAAPAAMTPAMIAPNAL